MKKLPLLLPAAIAILAACGETTPSPQMPMAHGPDDPKLAAMPVAKVGFKIQETPMSLTASDGTGLKLVALDARAVVDGPLAFTEMKMSFENPLDRNLEGTFRITLPQGASLGRFAMKISDEWQEGEVVELEAARRAYEDFLHRKQDPALLEKSAGNEFSARVFPIPARGKKEIVVSYVHEVETGKPFTIPLTGLPELGDLQAKVTVVGAKTQPTPVFAKNARPTDITVDPNALGIAKDTTNGVRAGDLAIVRVKPQTDSKPEPLVDTIVLVDTSASRALGFEEELKVVDKLVKSVGGSVTVATFDQNVTDIYEGKGTSFDIQKVRDRGALGASDLSKALSWAKDHAKSKHEKRVVVVTDGVTTAGDTEAKKIASDVSSLKDGGIERLDAIAVGGIRDDDGLSRLVRGKLPKDGVVAKSDGDWSRRLTEATRSGVSVKVEGASWSWPTKLDGVQAGDSYAVYAKVGTTQTIKVAVDGQAAKVVDLRSTERPLVERAVAQAEIGSLLEEETTAKKSMKKQITDIAVKNRIMTPYTAMLVLETEQDYARFHIDRKSLTDVLAIEDGKVRRVHRGSAVMAVATNDVPTPDKPEMKPKMPMEEKESNGAPNTTPRPQASAAPPPPKAFAADAKKDEGPSLGNATTATREAPRQGAPRPAAPPPPPGAQPTTPAAAPSPEPMAEAQAPRNRPARQAPPRDVDRDSDGIPDSEDRNGDDDDLKRESKAPYEGKFAVVMDQIAKGKKLDALETAKNWHSEEPGDVLGLVGLGEAAEAAGLFELASRAYGSIIDLFPNRADLRRFAGNRLERLPEGIDTAIDAFEKALADRPDHPSSHRMLAMAYARKHQYAKAFEISTNAIKKGYELGRYAGVDRILREDIGLIGAAWAKAEPAKADEIRKKIRESGGTIEDQPSLRFILSWETDANDVDFHIHDGKKGHAFYSQPHLRSGGDLYADVTTGYGPECFTIRGLKKNRTTPYRLEAHYYSRGPMGYGMGKLEVIDHDGQGNLVFEERPFVVMVDQAYVDLGTVR